jgi:hypothetical protein
VLHANLLDGNGGDEAIDMYGRVDPNYYLPYGNAGFAAGSGSDDEVIDVYANGYAAQNGDINDENAIAA